MLSAKTILIVSIHSFSSILVPTDRKRQKSATRTWDIRTFRGLQQDLRQRWVCDNEEAAAPNLFRPEVSSSSTAKSRGSAEELATLLLLDLPTQQSTERRLLACRNQLLRRTFCIQKSCTSRKVATSQRPTPLITYTLPSPHLLPKQLTAAHSHQSSRPYTKSSRATPLSSHPQSQKH